MQSPLEGVGYLRRVAGLHSITTLFFSFFIFFYFVILRFQVSSSFASKQVGGNPFETINKKKVVFTMFWKI